MSFITNSAELKQIEMVVGNSSVAGCTRGVLRRVCRSDTRVSGASLSESLSGDGRAQVIAVLRSLTGPEF